MSTRRLIRTDGTSEDLPGPVSIKWICQAIGADTLDTVALRHMGLPLHVMCVDDNGYETKVVERPGPTHGFIVEVLPGRARKPVNVVATGLYHLNCEPGTQHQIVGDVVVVPDDDFL